MTPFEHQAKIKAQIFGSYNNADSLIKKSEADTELGKAKDDNVGKTDLESKEEQ